MRLLKYNHNKHIEHYYGSGMTDHIALTMNSLTV